MLRPWLSALVCCAALATPSFAWAACDWLVRGRVHLLLADCQLSEGVLIPDGATIDGQHHRITLHDSASGPFKGAALRAGGRAAHVRNLEIDGSGLGPGCEGGASRLVGILFEGASGTIDGVSIRSLARFNGTCAEGTGIEIVGGRDQRPPMTAQAVSVRASIVESYQKGGLTIGGDVFVLADGNRFTASAALVLPSNGIQVAFGARATLVRNTVEGASWCCTDVAATGILLLDAAAGTEVRQNRIMGNADVGIFAVGRRFAIEGNDVIDEGGDGLFDVGILVLGDDHTVRGNVVRGFTVPYEGLGTDDTRTRPKRVAE